MNIFIITLLTTLSVSVAAAQTLLGVRAGVSTTNIRGNFLENTNSIRGFYGGITYEHLIKEKFSFGIDVVYNQFGFSSDTDAIHQIGKPTGGVLSTEFDYNYVSLPVKVGCNFGRKLKAFGNLGLSPSILVYTLTSLTTFDANGHPTRYSGSYESDEARKFDLAGILEAGLAYPLKGRYWLFTSVLYQHSFTSITDENYFADSTIRHQGLTLSIGLKYNLRRS